MAITLHSFQRHSGSAAAKPVVRSFALPNGDRIVSLRSDTLRSAVRAANNALKVEHSNGQVGDRPKRR
jgi:hypothetical protein